MSTKIKIHTASTGYIEAEGDGTAVLSGDGTVEVSGSGTLIITDYYGDAETSVSGFGNKTEVLKEGLSRFKDFLNKYR